jgi:TolB-like protein/Flp pilus assembly protein TadD
VHYFFGEYDLDTDRRELKRGSELVSIGPQGFDLLNYLVCNRERVVSKDDLIEMVWQGRSISDSTLASQINAVRRSIGDSGEDQKLIRTLARKGFRFVGHVREEPSGGSALAKPGALFDRVEEDIGPALPLPDKPSIAVLPFENLSADPQQDYFADGVVEDVITVLSRLPGLFVIARNSTFTYKGRAVDVKQVGRELGVRYVLEGSVRKAADRVRITTQLVEAATRAHLWAERFEGTIDAVFDLQDQVAASVAGAIAPKLEQAEIQRAKRKSTESLDAYDCYLRGMAHLHQRNRQATGDALQLFYKATELDSEYAAAYGMAAWCYAWRAYNGWMTDRVKERSKGASLAQQAVERGKDDAIALSRGGYGLCVHAGEFDRARFFVDRALQLSPNLASAWMLSGLVRGFTGDPDIAIVHLANAMRLSPLDPGLYHMQAGTGFAHFLAGRLNEACTWAGRALREEPNWVTAAAVTAAAHALAGRSEEARWAMKRLRAVNPALRVSSFTPRFARRPEHLTLWQEGLRKAGLPE